MFQTSWLRLIGAAFIVLAFALSLAAQTPPQASPTPPDDDEPVRVTVEEIRLNVMARNEFDHFDPTLIPDDLMVVEDKIPHSVVSVRRLPAKVLLVLDMGGEMRAAKNLSTTQAAAANIVNSLDAEDSIAVLQYSDKPEILSEWSNKEAALETIARKLSFGRRSSFVAAMNLAAQFLNRGDLQNRHLVLVTDGLDGAADKKDHAAAVQKLLGANVSVHVLSYTGVELQKAVKRSLISGADGRVPVRTDSTHKASLPQPTQDLMNMPRIGMTINTDREMIRHARKHQESLRESQRQLNELAAQTGGAFISPESNEQLIAKGKEIAEAIDSNYVATYIPKRPLADSKPGETREVGIVSRRVGLRVQARRVFIVPNRNN